MVLCNVVVVVGSVCCINSILQEQVWCFVMLLSLLSSLSSSTSFSWPRG